MLMAVIAASCSGEEDMPGGESSDAILFRKAPSVSRSASDFDFVATKVIPLVNEADADTLYLNLHENAGWDDGTPVGRGTPAIDIAAGQSFAAYCIAKDATRTWSYMHNVEVSNTGTAYEYSPVRYWPGEGYTLDFYTYYPFGAKGVTFDAPDGQRPAFDFTVPSVVRDQPDLMMASVTGVSGNFNQVVGLDFKHLLSQVKFLSPADGEIAGGTLSSVTLTGVKNSAKWDGDSWTLGDAVADVTLPLGVQYGNGQDYGTDGRTLMMLPQNLDGAGIKVNFNSALTGDKTFTADLSGIWEQGKSYSYTITISPEYVFDLSSESSYIDAHYEKFMLAVRPKEIPADVSWILSSDVEGVTLLSETDFNNQQLTQYAPLREGYWVDRIVDNNGADLGSARGASTIEFKGNDPQNIMVFVPENTVANRNITLNVSVNGSVVATWSDMDQYCPAGTFGWEQTQDSEEGAYGFNWNKLISYQLVYSTTSSFGQNRETYLNNLITQNNAGSYARVQQFRYKFAEWRYCITLDYSKLNNLADALSRTDGRANTRALFVKGGEASTGAFETVILNTKKIESGHTNEDLFREMKQSDLYNGDLANFSNGSTNIVGSEAVGQVLKKNKYNLMRVGGESTLSYIPIIKEEDIVWYLPAVDQFSNLPTEVLNPINTGGWSSTAMSGSSNALLGNGSDVSRGTIAPVRACRY